MTRDQILALRAADALLVAAYHLLFVLRDDGQIAASVERVIEGQAGIRARLTQELCLSADGVPQ